MPALKRKLESNHKGGPQAKVKQEIKSEPAMDMSFPSDEWFDEMYGPPLISAAPSTSKITTKTGRKRKCVRQKKQLAIKKICTISRGDTEIPVIEISDGEELEDVFPVTKESTSTVIDQNKPANDDAKEEDDGGSDLEILFDSNGHSPNKEILASKNEQQSDQPAKELVQIAERPGKVTAAKEPGKNSAAKSKEAATPQEIHWERVFGVKPNPDLKIMAKIAGLRAKFAKEFKIFDSSIWKHMDQNLQNDHTFRWKMRVKEILTELLKEIYPVGQYNLMAVGSTINGCGSFNSDMDLCLCLFNPILGGFDTQRSFALKNLRKMQRLLTKEGKNIKSVQYIPAKVPILNIHFQPPYHTLEVDMNVNNLAGIYNSYLLHYYSRIDDKFSSLCLLVKHWAKKRGILDASLGYFNSYSLILMVLHFLQCGVCPPVLPNLQFLYPDFFTAEQPLGAMELFGSLPRPLPEVPENKQSIGELLIAFFIYYYKFDYDSDAISVRLGRTFPRDDLAANTQRFKIYIEEPFDHQNTARCVTADENWDAILKSLKDAVKTLALSSKPNLRNLI